MGSDGLLYLVGADGAIRRYRPDTSAGCKLMLDQSFGDAGKLVIEHKPTNPNLKAGALTADGKGHLFASADQVYAHGAWRLTGSKVDFWLVRTVGVTVAAIGTGLALAARQDRLSREMQATALVAAAGLAAIDVVYVAQRRIRPVYLLDAVAQALFLRALARRH